MLLCGKFKNEICDGDVETTQNNFMRISLLALQKTTKKKFYTKLKNTLTVTQIRPLPPLVVLNQNAQSKARASC